MKTIFYTQIYPYRLLLLSYAFALSLFVTRIYLTKSLFFSFLIWNLFLATVPYMFSQYLVNVPQLQKRRTFFYCILASWLLFLPNSPYIITDLIHLHNGRSTILWLDLFLVFVFALNGLLVGLLSLLDIYSIICDRWNDKIANTFLFISCFLSGYGIYLGRFLRFNSWDVFTKPNIILVQFWESIFYMKTWLVTFAFGGFLWIIVSILLTIPVFQSTGIKKVEK